MPNPSTPTVENRLPGYTNFNLSTAHATTMGTTTVTPLYVKAVLPGDKWRIKPALRVHTLPLSTSLMGTFTFRVAWFYESDANLYDFLDNNEDVSAQRLVNMQFHTIPWASNTQVFGFGSTSTSVKPATLHCRVGAGSLLNYLYLPVGFDSYYAKDSASTASTPFPLLADRWLGFWDIYRNYYVNRQIATFPYFSSYIEKDGSNPSESTNNWRISAFDTNVLDELIKRVRSAFSSETLQSSFEYVFGTLSTAYQRRFEIFMRSNFNGNPVLTTDSASYAGAALQETSAGLPLSNLRADVFSRMISANSADSLAIINFDASFDGESASGSVPYSSIVTTSKLFAFCNNIDLSGGRVSDWMRFRWGVDLKGNFNKPVCLSVDSVTLSVDDLRTTSSTEGQSAASQVGYIDVGKYLRKVSFNNKTGVGGNIFCICTITPNVYYSQGVEPEVTFTKFMDKYNPEFANEGFVGIPRFALGALPTKQTPTTINGLSEVKYQFTPFGTFTKSVGRTTSWWMYQTDVNRSYSLLSKGQSMEGWLLNRDFYVSDDGSTPGQSGDNGIRAFSYTPYGYPDEFNYPFVDTNPSAQNFIVQFAADINVRRVMPSYNQPKIG